VTGAAEAGLQLQYWNGTAWAQVRSSGGVAPVKDTIDNLDGTVSGGRFTVTFDGTSAPPVTSLTGTVFAPAGTANFTVSGSASPQTISPGETVAVAAIVTSSTASTVVVNVEVHDATNTKIFQQFFDDVTFAAGETKTFNVNWPVPATQTAGTYDVLVGVFDQPFEIPILDNTKVAQVTVQATATPTPTPTLTPTPTATTTPAGPCAPRPSVALTVRAIGGGRLEATIGAQTLPATPSNGLEQIVFTSLQNGAVQLGAGPVAPGATIPLGGASTITFIVTRQVAGQPTHVAFTVRDGCGEWPSFVGGGPTAF